MEKNTVLFCGDTSVSVHSRDLFQAGDIDALFNDILPVLNGAEHVVVNLETSVTDQDTPIVKCGPNLRGPVEMPSALKRAGIDACGLANNHVYDFGAPGLRDTFRYLDEAGLARFGAGETEEEACAPYFFTVGDKKIAVLAVGEHEYNYAIGNHIGAAPFDPFDTMVRIRETKEKANYLVIMYHGGKEQCEYPSPRLRKACHAFVKLGADMVLCQHSHIVGTYEYFENGFILYGQGNFHFVNYLDLKGWTNGLIVKTTFADQMSIELIPVDSTEHGMRLASPEKAKEILDGLEQRSKSLLDGTWIDGWNAFVEEKREPYTKVVRDSLSRGDDPVHQNEYFAHYLDCEAHTDVWKTLFQTWHMTGTDDPYDK